MERKDCNGYTLWLFNVAMENHIFVIGKPSINGAFSMAMLNNQMVYMVTICHNGLMWFMYGDS